MAVPLLDTSTLVLSQTPSLCSPRQSKVHMLQVLIRPKIWEECETKTPRNSLYLWRIPTWSLFGRARFTLWKRLWQIRSLRAPHNELTLLTRSNKIRLQCPSMITNILKVRMAVLPEKLMEVEQPGLWTLKAMYKKTNRRMRYLLANRHLNRLN